MYTVYPIFYQLTGDSTPSESGACAVLLRTTAGLEEGHFLGLRVWGLGLRIEGLGFGVYRVEGLGFRVDAAKVGSVWGVNVRLSHPGSGF